MYCASHAKCIFADPLQMPHACHRFWKFWNCYKTVTFCSLLARCRIPCTCRAKSHLNLVRACGAFNILTWTCASRHNRVHFLNISTSRSVLNVVCWCILTSKCASRNNNVHFFNISTSKSALNISERGVLCTFDLDMYFAPQRRATFHLSSDQMAPHPPL